MSPLDDPEAFFKFSALATHFSINYNGGDYLYRWTGTNFTPMPLNPSNAQLYAHLVTKDEFLKESEKAKEFLTSLGKTNVRWHFSSYIQEGDSYSGLN